MGKKKKKTKKGESSWTKALAFRMRLKKKEEEQVDILEPGLFESHLKSPSDPELTVLTPNPRLYCVAGYLVQCSKKFVIHQEAASKMWCKVLDLATWCRDSTVWDSNVCEYTRWHLICSHYLQ